MSYDHESHHGGRRPLPALELLTVLVGSMLILAGAIAYALGGGVGLAAAIGMGALIPRVGSAVRAAARRVGGGAAMVTRLQDDHTREDER